MEKEEEENEEILIITDSNGRHFQPKLLHDKKNVVMEQIYTLDGATQKIPERKSPDAVKDIVFMTGLNDSKDHRTSVEEIVNRQKEACHKYHHKYKKGKIPHCCCGPRDSKGTKPKQTTIRVCIKCRHLIRGQ